MIEGLGLIYPISFLRFSKTFLRISMDAVYNCNRLDFDSNYLLLIHIIIRTGNKHPYCIPIQICIEISDLIG